MSNSGRDSDSAHTSGFRASNLDLGLILGRIPVAAYTCDAEGLITYFNAMAEELWGRKPLLNDPIDRYCGSFKLFSAAGAAIPHNDCWMALALQNRRSFTRREILIERPDGTRRSALAHASPLFGDDGGLVGAINFLVDLSDYKKAELELRAVTENTPDFISCMDREGRMLYINHLAPGFRMEDVIGRSTYDFTPPEDHAAMKRGLKRVFEPGEDATFESRGMGPNREMRWYMTRMAPIVESGRVQKALVIATDITERKKAEDVLADVVKGFARQQGQDFFESVCRHLAESLGASWVSVVEVEGPPFETATVRAGFLDGKSLAGKTYPVAGTPCELVLKGGELSIPDEVAQRFNQDVLLAEWGIKGYAGTPLKDSSGRTLGLLCAMWRHPLASAASAMSVLAIYGERVAAEWERERARNDLVRKEELLRLAVKGADLGFWDWDIKTGKTTNIGWTWMLGYQDGEIPANFIGWEGLVHNEDKSGAISRLQAHLAGECPLYEAEFRLRTKSGEWKWILARGQVVDWDADGKPSRMAGTHLDISDRKARADALVRQTEALKTLNQVSQLLTRELDKERLIQVITDCGTRITGARFGAFFYNVNNEQGESYTLFALSGAERKAFEQFPLPRNTPFFRPTYEGSAVVRVANVREDPRYGKEAPHFGLPSGHLPVTSYLAVPVKSRSGEVLGGLFFGHELPGVFDQTSEEVALGIAAHASIGLENAQLFLRLKKELEERKRAEAALQESKDVFEAFMGHRPAIAFWKSEDDRLLYVNKAFEEQIWDGKPPDWKNRKGEEIWPPEMAKNLRENDQRILSTGKPEIVEEDVLKEDRIENWLSIKFPLNLPSGERRLAGMALNITDRKRAQERVRSVIESSPSGIIVVDGKGCIEMVNARVEALFGYDRSELNGRPIEMLVPKALREGHAQLRSAYMKAPTVRSMGAGLELYACRKDGSVFPVEVGLNPLSGDRQFGIVLVTVLDITQRKKVEDALRESEERLRLAHKATNDVVWDWDVIHDTKQWNEAGRVVFGWDEVIDHPVNAHWWVERVHPDDRRRVEDGFFKILNDPATDFWRDEYRFRKSDDSYVEVMDRGYVIRDAQGKAVRMIGAMLDVTKSKQAEALLKDERNRLSAILDTAGDPIFVKDNDHRIVLANRAFCDIFNLDAHVVIGKTLAESVPEDERVNFLAVDRHVLDTGEPDLREETLTVDGLTRHIITQKARFIAESGQKFLVGSIHDITKRKLAGEALRASEERLRLAVTGADLGFWDWNIPTGQTQFSEQWLGMLGYAPDELAQNFQTWEQLLHPEDKGRVSEILQAHLDGKTSFYEVDFRMRTKDERWRWVHSRGQVVERDGEGRPVRMAGTHHDISARKAAELSLLEAKRFTQETLDSLTANIAIVDANGVVVAVNRRWREYGEKNSLCSKASCIGTNYLDVCNATEGAERTYALAVARMIQEVAAGKREEGQVRYPCRTPEELRWYDARITRVQEQQPVRVIISHEDVTAHVRQEEALAEREKRYRLLADNSGDMISLHAPDATFRFVSPACENVYGYAPEEMLQLDTFSLVHPEDLQQFRTAFETLLRTKRSITIAFRGRRKDGSYQWVESDCRPVLSSDGRTLVEIQASTRDIAARMKAEQAVRESELQYRTLVTSMSEGVVHYDVNGQIVMANESAERILGLSLDQMLGRTSVDPRWGAVREDGRLFAEDEHPAMVTLRSGRPVFNATMGVNRPDGSQVWISVNAHPIRDGGNKPVGVVATFADITARLKAERALKRSEEGLRTLADNLIGAAYRCACDEHWTMDFISKGILELSGYPAEDFLGNRVRSFNSIIHPDDQVQVAKSVHSGIGRKEPYAMEYRIIRSDGTVCWVFERGQGVFEPSGELKCLEGVIVDVSDRKELERELAHIGERERQRIGRDLHDTMGQDLAAINYQLFALKRGLAAHGENPAISEQLESVGQALQQVTERVQNLSRGLCPPAFEAGSLCESLRSLAETSSRSMAISCHYINDNEGMDTDNAEVIAHVYRIAQEAITNAVKHGRAENVWIRQMPYGQGCVFRITNDGLPMKLEGEMDEMEGLGLRNMRWRAQLIDAKLKITLDDHCRPMIECVLACPGREDYNSSEWRI